MQKRIRWQWKALVIGVLAAVIGFTAGVYVDREWLYDDYKINQILDDTVNE